MPQMMPIAWTYIYMIMIMVMLSLVAVLSVLYIKRPSDGAVIVETGVGKVWVW